MFALSGSPAWAAAMLALTGAAAVAFVLGWHTRLVTPLFAVLVFSLQERNPYVTDGGDNLLRILLVYLVYLVFADCGARWSLDARRRQKPDMASTRTAWQDGTAIYYVLRDAQFSTWPGISRLISHDALVVNLLTWGTVLLQVAFPLLLMRTWTRRAALIGTTSFHLGIGLLMGLPLFSATMILAEAVLVSDRTWERLVTTATRRMRSSSATGAPRPSGPDASAQGAPIGASPSTHARPHSADLSRLAATRAARGPGRGASAFSADGAVGHRPAWTPVTRAVAMARRRLSGSAQ